MENLGDQYIETASHLAIPRKHLEMPREIDMPISVEDFIKDALKIYHNGR